MRLMNGRGISFTCLDLEDQVMEGVEKWWLPLPEEADRLFEEAGLEPIHTISEGAMRISALQKP